MACNPINVFCKVKEKAEDAVGDAVVSGADAFGEAMMGAWDSLMKSFLTSWLDVGILVSLDTGSVPWLIEQLHVFSVVFAVVGVMIACIWTMVHARGDKAIQVSKSLFRVFLVTSLGTALIQVVLTAGDSFSTWVLDSAGVSSAGYAELAAAGVAVGPGLAIIAGIFGVVATLFQWCIMMVRAVVLPLLVAVWPLSAAASMVQGGEESFSKVTKWLVAFLLYKPVAAIVYAFAWKMKSGEEGLGGIISGMLLLVLAVAALPALMKLVAPGTSALGGAAGGTMAMAAGAAVVSAGVAVGAAVATGGSSAGASAGTAGKAAGPAASSPTAATGNTAMPSQAAPSPDSGSTAVGSGDSGNSGNSGPAGSPGSAGTIGDAGDSAPSGSDSPAGQNGTAGASGSNSPAGQNNSPGPSGAATEAGGNGAPAPTGGNSAGGSSSSNSGLQAGAESIGGTVADGAKDSDGKDVIGE